MDNFLAALSRYPMVQVLFYGSIFIVLLAVFAYEPVYTAIGRGIKSLFAPFPETVLEEERQQRITAYQKMRPEEKFQQSRTQSDFPGLGVGDGFKFGFGFAAGVFVFLVIISIAGSIFFGVLLTSMLKLLFAGMVIPTR